MNAQIHGHILDTYGLQTHNEHLNITAFTVKGKVQPLTSQLRTRGERTYSSTVSLTSALDGGAWATPRPGRTSPTKETR
jgi:hypothetical protein